MKTIIMTVVGLVVVGLVWSAVASWAGRKSVESAIESQAGGDVDYNADGTVTYTSDEGGVSTTGKLPDNWPSDAPVFSGATVAYAGYSTDGEGTSGTDLGAALTSTARLEDIIAFYKKSLTDNGWTIETEANVNGTTVLSAIKDQRTYSISIVPGEDLTTITVGISTNR